ncbi:MAG: hypothetical protein DHS20C16_11410 [Phycisphaerae bacterium]|nr:MAG: hypothetical protein DHS20C16_11410 [Phycisphaerae bacterium]
MSLLETILGAGGGAPVEKLGGQFGLKGDQVGSILKQLVPALNAGVKRNTKSPDGLASLLGALANKDHDRYLDDPDLLEKDDTVKEGNGILGHLLGSKDVSRQLAGRASSETGVDAGIIKKMLPLVATMVMGSMRKETRQLGATVEEARQKGSGNPLASFLDADGDGSIVDDLFGMAKKFF